jgi:hypothetical protein
MTLAPPPLSPPNPPGLLPVILVPGTGWWGVFWQRLREMLIETVIIEHPPGECRESNAVPLTL